MIKNHQIFKECASIVDPAFYVESCKYDLCLDGNLDHRSLYRCKAVATYAQECANHGIFVDWLNHPEFIDLKSSCQDIKYGICYGGSKYSDCARLTNTTCRELSYRQPEMYSHHIDHCVAGCSCPEGQYYDNLNGIIQCVPKDSCSCYEPIFNKYYPANHKIKKGCSTCQCFGGELKCDNVDCKDVIKCPNNQIFSRNATTCPRTCGNIDHYRDCQQTIEGCTCPDGLILDYFVIFFYLSFSNI